MSLKPEIKDWTFQVNEQTNRSEKEFDSNMSLLLIFIIYSCNLLSITRGTNLFEINRLGILFFFWFKWNLKDLKAILKNVESKRKMLSLQSKIRLLNGNSGCFPSK